MITNLKMMPEGHLSYDEDGRPCLANLHCLLVRRCWHNGMDLEDLADGFGPGSGTHGDWSAVRDSSPEAWAKMLERALNFMKGS